MEILLSYNFLYQLLFLKGDYCFWWGRTTCNRRDCVLAHFCKNRFFFPLGPHEIGLLRRWSRNPPRPLFEAGSNETAVVAFLHIDLIGTRGSRDSDSIVESHNKHELVVGRELLFLGIDLHFTEARLCFGLSFKQFYLFDELRLYETSITDSIFLFVD